MKLPIATANQAMGVPDRGKGTYMLGRHHSKQAMPFKDRLTAFAEEARQKATELPPGPERDEMLKKARQADTACHLDAWANSPGLRPPA